MDYAYDYIIMNSDFLAPGILSFASVVPPFQDRMEVPLYHPR
jgi:hypothetical protein